MDQLLLPGDKLFVIADETKPKSKIQNKHKLKNQTTNGVDFKKTCNCGKEAFQQSETPGNNSEFSLSNMKEFINQTSNERPKQKAAICKRAFQDLSIIVEKLTSLKKSGFVFSHVPNAEVNKSDNIPRTANSNIKWNYQQSINQSQNRPTSPQPLSCTDLKRIENCLKNAIRQNGFSECYCGNSIDRCVCRDACEMESLQAFLGQCEKQMGMCGLGKWLCLRGLYDMNIEFTPSSCVPERKPGKSCLRMVTTETQYDGLDIGLRPMVNKTDKDGKDATVTEPTVDAAQPMEIENKQSVKTIKSKGKKDKSAKKVGKKGKKANKKKK